jgi:metal-dependent amidase/aminoacylase/carboxypeptidase family protein
MTTDTALDRVLRSQESIQQWQDDLYIHLHRNPQLSYVEHQTHDRIAQELRDAGVEDVREHIGGTGLRTVY